MLEYLIIKEVTEAVAVELPQGKKMEINNRPCWGLTFCEYGNITYFFKNRIYISDPKHAVLLPKGQDYKLVCNEAGRFPVINFTCLQEPEEKEFGIFAITRPEHYRTLFDQIQKKLIMETDLLGNLSLLYGTFSGLVMEQRASIQPLKMAMGYLEKNIFLAELTNSKIAAAAGVSLPYLNKLFQQAYGMTPKRYVIDTRMRKAKQLLKETTLPVTQIATNTGFSSVYHFCRAFRTHIGITPSEYRAIFSNRAI